MECALWTALTDYYAKIPMAITAENLAVKYNITREDCDNFVLLSQKRWSDAQKSGKFKLGFSLIVKESVFKFV